MTAQQHLGAGSRGTAGAVRTAIWVILAVTIGVGVWFTADTLTKPQTPPWIISGSHGGGLVYTGIPYPGSRPWYVIEGSHGGAIIYRGIPYTPAGD